MMKVGSINAVKLVMLVKYQTRGGWQRLYLNNNHHSGLAIWMEMTRNGYRFNLEGWSLSRVAMVVFRSRSTVALHPI